jgi:hypothetical protein
MIFQADCKQEKLCEIELTSWFVEIVETRWLFSPSLLHYLPWLFWVVTTTKVSDFVFSSDSQFHDLYLYFIIPVALNGHNSKPSEGKAGQQQQHAIGHVKKQVSNPLEKHVEPNFSVDYNPKYLVTE